MPRMSANEKVQPVDIKGAITILWEQLVPKHFRCCGTEFRYVIACSKSQLGAEVSNRRRRGNPSHTGCRTALPSWQEESEGNRRRDDLGATAAIFLPWVQCLHWRLDSTFSRC
jgi:hypothetical protein